MVKPYRSNKSAGMAEKRGGVWACGQKHFSALIFFRTFLYQDKKVQDRLYAMNFYIKKPSLPAVNLTTRFVSSRIKQKQDSKLALRKPSKFTIVVIREDTNYG